jgi:alpha-D-xyloside xylohydrolase
VIEKLTGKKPWTVCLRNIAAVRGITGGTARPSEAGVLITPQAARLTVIL